MSSVNSAMDLDTTSETGASTESSKRIIIAIDLGTTFSNVSYVCIPSDASDAVRSAIGPDDVECIDCYPDIPFVFGPAQTTQRCDEVPTEIWYSKASSSDLEPGEPQSPNGASPDVDDDSAAEQERACMEPTHQKKRKKGPMPRNIAWGYGVQTMMRYRDSPAKEDAKISKFKLMLDSEDRDITRDIRTQVNQICSILKREKVIVDKTQLFSDYLTKLLSHARTRLEATRSLSADTELDFVICVPNIWSEKARRTMHNVTATAIKSSGLGSLIDSHTIDNLFIVSEPEAAATFALADVKHQNDRLLPGEVFVLLDAGGGTVDATTYRITQTHPLRLNEEVVHVGGAMCGSSFLNDRYRKVLKARLDGKQPPPGLSLEVEIEELVGEFEHVGKRKIDVCTDDRIKPDRIRWLQADPQRRIRQKGYISWTRGEMRGIFQESLDGVERVLHEQLVAAVQRPDPVSVKKVILVGGFGQSKSLQSHLRQFLQTQQNYIGRPIDLVTPEEGETSSVARGAVLRALNKKDGPQRYLQTSFGLLRTELHDPDNVAAHQGIQPKSDKVDGFDSIENTIYWVLQKGMRLPPIYEHEPISMWHLFRPKSPKLICEEVLFVSERNHESSYKRYNHKNAGAQKMATINIDMTSLRDDGHLQLVYPKGVDNPDPSRLHYRIEMDLFVTVENRNLSFEAVWPARDSEERRQGAQEVRRKATVSIASSFAPGTA